MGVPYEMPPAVGLHAAGGSAACFALNLPGRMLISKIVCKQVSGVAVSFTLALFNREQACDGLGQSESAEQGVGFVDPDLHRVTPDLAGAAGTLLYFSDQASGGHGFTFVGMEPDRLGRSRKVYARITPQGSGAKEFQLAIAGESFGGE